MNLTIRAVVKDKLDAFEMWCYMELLKIKLVEIGLFMRKFSKGFGKREETV